MYTVPKEPVGNSIKEKYVELKAKKDVTRKHYIMTILKTLIVVPNFLSNLWSLSNAVEDNVD